MSNNRSYRDRLTNNNNNTDTDGRNHYSYRSRSSHNNSDSTSSRYAHSRLSNYERDDRNNKNSKYQESYRRDYKKADDERRVPSKQRNDENYDSRAKRNCREKPVADLNELNCVKSEPLDWSSRQTSPLKRRNNEDSENSISSPQKRLRENMASKCIGRFNLSSYTSPKKRSSSLCTIKKENKYASTPKSERRLQHTKKIKEMIEQDSINMKRNMSNDWADILEELEEQTKEVEKYIEKVSEKYEIDKDRLTKSLETEAETLRKRQKRINFGKVTEEYQRYIIELPHKSREPFHPRTPNKFRKCSRRKFDGLIKKWRKLLHAFDENPDQLADMKHSVDDSNDCDITDIDFGGASNVGSGISGYNIDDFDILDSDMSEDKLVVDTPMEAI